MRSFRGEDSLDHWLDRHHLDVIRTMATTFDGTGIGAHLHRHAFVKSLPNGSHIRDLPLAMDLVANERNSLRLKPDLATLIQDRHEPNLGHCIAEYALADGKPMSICPRTTLRRVVEQLNALHYEAMVAFELEFYLFHSPYDQVYQDLYQGPKPAARPSETHSIRHAYHIRDFMNEVTRRMGYLGVEFESWNNLANGQVQLNLTPGDPLSSADCVIRTKEALYEVAVDHGIAVTFMTTPVPDYSSAMLIRHKLTSDHVSPGSARACWIGGLAQELGAAMSYLRPSGNDYRQLPAATCSWGDDTSCAIRSLDNVGISVEHRVSAADLNPYLALSAILAGGIVGLTHQIEVHPNSPGTCLPLSLSDAVSNLEKDTYLSEVIGQDAVDRWLSTRQKEILDFQRHAADDNTVSQWEFDRYFEII